MNDFAQYAGEINVKTSEVFEVALESQAASTGYTWTLATMPNCLNLLDISYHTSTSAVYGSKGTQVFRFVALHEAKACLDFGLVSPGTPHKVVKKKSYIVVIERAVAGLAEELKDTIGAGRFVSLAANKSCTAGGPLPPYGVPMQVVEDKERCVLMYGIPTGIARNLGQCVLKYGVPVESAAHDSLKLLRNAEDGGIIVVYGVPTPEYGIPAITSAAARNMTAQCHVPMPLVEDKDNCVVKYGIPGGIPSHPKDCILKYGVPAVMAEDPDNCVVKYGTPGGSIGKDEECILKYGAPLLGPASDDCIVKYGAPNGELAKGKNCVMKYGIPTKAVKSDDNCLVKYGTPNGMHAQGEGCVLKYGIPAGIKDASSAVKKTKN